MWKHRGNERPYFAIVPKEGQESVWDYPRPPILKEDLRKIEVYDETGILLAQTNRSFRVLETASPPTFYIPSSDVLVELKLVAGSTFCEWKGAASYFAHKGLRLAWRYDNPSDRFSTIDGYYSFYASVADCRVDGERVQAQAGDFYGGWITKEVVGPFKGDPGTTGW